MTLWDIYLENSFLVSPINEMTKSQMFDKNPLPPNGYAYIV